MRVRRVKQMKRRLMRIDRILRQETRLEILLASITGDISVKSSTSFFGCKRALEVLRCIREESYLACAKKRHGGGDKFLFAVLSKLL